MRKKVLITGGAGFIGSALTQKLLELSYDVYIIDDLSFGNREFVKVSDDRFFKVDILDKEAVTEAFMKANPAIVIHLAAVHFIPYCNKHPFKSSEINIRGTMNVLDCVASMENVEKLMFASTAAVYPIADGPISEKHALMPLDIYGLTKLAGERLCNEFHLKTGIPVVICRFFNAFGPNETNPHLIPEIQQQINGGERTIHLGNLSPKRDFIHTYDMSEAIIRLLDKFSDGFDVFNLGSGIEYSVTEIVAAFENQLSEKINVVVDPDRVRKVERMHLLADISKLRSFINWAPTISIEEGIKTLISYQPAT